MTKEEFTELIGSNPKCCECGGKPDRAYYARGWKSPVVICSDCRACYEASIKNIADGLFRKGIIPR